ncbi:hypothetical protein Taro_013403 [Colocasia esculenta]|uniref:DEK-C domain-containing protein n=1 Tax=Colocasia esculenta TaxID=4460 RepID=A0A843UBT2_COLES|nr:hypothetical protein [Colocasia esculenta]
MDAATQRRIREAVVDILKGADMAETTEFKVRSAAAQKLGIDLSLPERKRFVRGIVESFLISSSQKKESPAGTGRGGGADVAGGSGKESGRGGRVEEDEEEEEAAEEEEGDEREEGRREREYDDEGNLIVCHLSNRRRVSIQDFRGKTLVSIREYYDKGGKQLPSSKGISLTTEQWAAFRDAVPSIEDAINKLKSRLD